MRFFLIIAAAAVVAISPTVGADELATRNVVLVTLDGVRTQEIFSGMDAAIAAHSAEDVYSEIETGRERYWAELPVERRRLLMPFFWGTLVPNGMLFGNEEYGSRMLVRNDIKWSSPGYAEMLTGAPHAEIVDNTLVRYPYRTVLEYAVEALGLQKSGVAQIGSWDGFPFAAASRDDAFVMNGAFQPFPAEYSTPEIDALVDIRQQVMELWEESSNDGLTYRIARAYLRAHQPRLMWIGFGQSDDWSHADRYDRLVEYLHLADRWIADLWATIEEHPAYRGKTTLIVTTDHGRGLTPSDWAEHDQTIPGSEAIWLAVIGPDTPALGERVPEGTLYQGSVATTIAELLGLDPADFNPEAEPPLPGVVANH